MKNYLNLAIGAPRRLAILKRDAEQFLVRNPHLAKFGTVKKSWKDVRYATFKSERGLSQGFNDGMPVWYGFELADYFRETKEAHDIISLRHTGYYTDLDCCHLAKGIVASLPHGKFLAGYYWEDNGEYCFYEEIYTDKEDAARAADSYAESFADEAREHDYQYRQARDLEDEIEQSLQRLRECIALRHRKCMDYVREEILELTERIRSKRKTLATEYAEFV